MNIAEILKNYPEGTKLYSPLCGECELIAIECNMYPIHIQSNDGCFFYLTRDGKYKIEGECLLFPSKDNRDWTNFFNPKYLDPDSSVVETVKQSIEECKKSMKSPVLLKKGDFIVSYLNSIGIVNYQRHGSDIDCFVIMRNNEHLLIKNRPEYICNMIFSPFATEEEKQKLLKAIDKKGYVWDDEMLELRKKEHQFQPFEKVLVRDIDEEPWKINLFSHIITDSGFYYVCIAAAWKQCIPYKGNEHLLGTDKKPE